MNTEYIATLPTKPTQNLVQYIWQDEYNSKLFIIINSVGLRE